MTTERFEYDKHYPELSVWLSHYGWPEIAPHMLPSFGSVSINNDQMVCVGFLYKTDSSVALLEWVVGNPDAPFEIRAEGIKSVVKALLKEAKRDGFEAVFSFLRNKRLLGKYEETGFIITDEEMTHGVWRI